MFADSKSIEITSVLGQLPLSMQEADPLEKLLLWHGAQGAQVFDCKKVLERSFPGISHDLGMLENLPPFECYFLGSELLLQVSEAADREHDEVLV